MGTRRALTKYHKITPDQMMAQIRLLPCKVDRVALDFSTDVAKRAQKVFRNSFRYHRFYSGDASPWKPLSEATIAKRRRKCTLHGGILNEYGTLKGSIEFATGNGFQTTINHISRQRIFTNPSKFNVSTNPHRGFCYAGVHNNPGPNETYGNGFGGRKRVVKVVQRQFMGYSTYIDNYVEENMNKYLFDALFGNASSIVTISND